MNRISYVLSILLNAAIVCATYKSVYGAVYYQDGVKLAKGSLSTFKYFTTDSNVLCALAALIVLAFDIKGLVTGNHVLPQGVLTLKYLGTVSVTVTLLTVVAFLGPTQGFKPMFHADGKYLHLVCPLLAIISFCVFEKGLNLSFAFSLYGVLPVFLYGTVYLVMVVIKGENMGGWKDFYGFNANGMWVLSYIAMHVGTLAICESVRALYKAF